jgi:cation diffusion facilitator family transporter
MTTNVCFKIDNAQEVPQACRRCGESVGQVSFWGNIALLLLKLFGGVMGSSSALIADAFHSLADVISAVITWICLRFSKSPPDEDHPYGHGQMEYVAALGIGVSLLVVVTLIVARAIASLLSGVTTTPTLIAVFIEFICIAGNELMASQSICAGNRLKSPAMLANGIENRADVWSSVAALIGVLAAQLGLKFMDPVAAIAVSMFILHSAWRTLRMAWSGFTDYSAGRPVEQRIKQLAEAIPGVRGVSFLRSRVISSYLVIDMGISVAPDLPLKEGCEIAERVKDAVLKEVGSAGLITVRANGKLAVREENVKETRRSEALNA